MNISLSELRDGFNCLNGCSNTIVYCVAKIQNAGSVSTANFTSSCENYSSNLSGYLSTISELSRNILQLREFYDDFYSNAMSVFQDLMLLCGYSDFNFDANDLSSFVFDREYFINDYTLFYENGIDGVIKVENGLFYLPDDALNGTEEARGTGGYGYNVFFKKRLDALLDGLNKSFGREILSYGTDEDDGGFRSLEKQKSVINKYGSNANPVGKSDHGWGIASDLKKAKEGISDYDYSLAIKWCKDHCKDYGLEFPYSKEYWHIQIPLDSIVRNNQANVTNENVFSHNSSSDNNSNSSFENASSYNISSDNNVNSSFENASSYNISSDNNANSSSENVYIVQSGQTLSSIASGLGMSWEDLYNKNKDILSSPNKIYPGQELKY